MVQESNMSSGGCDPPRPPSPSGNKGKQVMKGTKRYEIKVLSRRDNFTSSITSPVVASRPSPFPVIGCMSSSSIAIRSTPSPSSGATSTPSPSPGATSTPSPSPNAIGTPNVNPPPTSEDLNEEDPPLDDLPLIKPTRNGFLPSKTASTAITRTIKQQYHSPWVTWGEIPQADKDIFFQRFKRMVKWSPEHESNIKKNFNAKASHRLSEMFMDARKKNKKPDWIGDRVWNSLLEHWNVPTYRTKCTQAQKNRASEKGGSMHTCGSISMNEHAIRMEKELGRPVHHDELFQQTHIRKDTGQFVDDRSRRTHEDFEARFSQAISEVGSTAGTSECTPLDPVEEDRLRSQCWNAAIGKKYKGRRYGTGDLYENEHSSFVGTSSSQSQNTQEISQLTQRVLANEEEMRRMRSQYQTEIQSLTSQYQTQFNTFLNAVLPFLPPTMQTTLQQQQQHQQPNRHQQQDNRQPTEDEQANDQHQQHSPGYSNY
ncbi:uncharacterized protein LOC109793794 isoform X3 [Cajanus cajan]|uniref:uncharacterized protein LOC109793794 isoform X3 n=1 Tax=Cajanus cajan TaxID=3821 RepID=UPI00098DCD1C|nr:uncharacterized protein LOC109793794 isoform X3 [Cajanus cajan]XP_029126266.1 uncharacterized protein LOC109793794 isoform X3 [Cajanus cajan]